MAVSTNATTFDAPSAPALSLSNRFQPLEELSHDEEATNSYSKFQAQGVYKPPHMRIPSESVASITGPDPTANSTSGVRTVHGPSSDHKKKGASRPNTPHIGSTSGSAVFGFDEIKKKIHEEVLMVRKAAKEMETIEKDFLEEGARFEQDLKVLKSAGLTDQEIRKLIGWNPTNLPSKPLSLEPLDVNNFGKDLARISLRSEQEVEQPEKTHEEKPLQQAEEDLVNKTPIPGGPVYSSVTHPRGIHQTGKYGHSTPSATPANNAHYETFLRQATGWNDQVQAHSGIMSCHGSIPTGTFQVPGQIYQTGFNSSVDSLPPRFRQPPVYHQPVPLHHQNVTPNGPRNTIPAGHPVPWPPVLNIPQNSTQNHTFRPASMPPPPRPYFYEADLVFDFEGFALSSKCNPNQFVMTYWKMNGHPPSSAAWAAWVAAVEKVGRARQYENQKATEQEIKEGYGIGSRLQKWCTKSSEDLPGSNPGYSSSLPDASTKAGFLKNSEVGDGGSKAVSVFGSNGKREIGMPRAQKRWKDVADETWIFGEPLRPDDPEHYMSRVTGRVGWRVRDPRFE